MAGEHQHRLPANTSATEADANSVSRDNQRAGRESSAFIAAGGVGSFSALVGQEGHLQHRVERSQGPWGHVGSSVCSTWGGEG